MQAATLRISMMNKLHDFMSEEDFEALRMTSMERVTAATLAEKVHDLGYPFDVVATSISSSNINEGVQEYIQLMGDPHIIVARPEAGAGRGRGGQCEPAAEAGVSAILPPTE